MDGQQRLALILQPFDDNSELFVVFQALMSPLLQSRWHRFQTKGFTG